MFLTLPGLLVTLNAIMALLNIFSEGVPLLAPSTKYGLAVRRSMWVILAFVTFIFMMLALILFGEQENAPTLLCFDDGVSFVFSCAVYIGSLWFNAKALFLHLWPVPSNESTRHGKATLDGIIENEAVDLMELSILYVTEIYKYPHAQKLRELTCHCVPSLPIDELEESLAKSSLSKKEDVEREAHAFLDVYIEELEKDHEIHERHVGGCAEVGFSEAAQNRLASHLEQAKKRV